MSTEKDIDVIIESDRSEIKTMALIAIVLVVLFLGFSCFNVATKFANMPANILNLLPLLCQYFPVDKIMSRQRRIRILNESIRPRIQANDSESRSLVDETLKKLIIN